MLKVWQLTTRLTTPKMVHHSKGHQGTVRSLALVLRRLADGRAVRTLRRSASAGEPTSNEVRDLAVSPDRRRVASAASDGRLSIWDLETGEAMRTPEAHGYLVIAR